MVAAKSSALELAQLMPSSSVERIELGLICLKKVYGSEWLYDPNFGSFTSTDIDVRSDFKNDLMSLGTAKSQRYANRVDSATLAALKAAWTNEYAVLEAEQTETQNQLICAGRELSQTQADLRVLALAINATNDTMIELKTKEACERLNSSDPNAAILNPVCREWFKDNFHPDLELADATSRFSVVAEKMRKHQSVVDGLSLSIEVLERKMAQLKLSLAGEDITESELEGLDCTKYKS